MIHSISNQMKTGLIEFAQISKKKAIRYLWVLVENFALWIWRMDGSSKEKKSFRQEFKEKDSSLAEKKN